MTEPAGSGAPPPRLGRFEIRTSRLKSALLAGLSALLVLAGWWMVATPARRVRRGFGLDSHVWGWLTIILFGAGVLILVWQAIRPRTLLVVDDDAVSVPSRWRFSSAPWTSVTALQRLTVAGQQYLYVHVDESVPHKTRPFMPRTVMFSVVLSGAEVSPDEIVRRVAAYAIPRGIPLS